MPAYTLITVCCHTTVVLLPWAYTHTQLAASLFPIFIKNKTGILLSQFFQHRQRHVVDHVGMLLDKDLPFFRTDMAIPSQVSFLECLHAQSTHAPEWTTGVCYDRATTIQTHPAFKSLHSELQQVYRKVAVHIKLHNTCNCGCQYSAAYNVHML